MERDAVAQPVGGHVAAGQCQRAGGQVDRVDPRPRKGEGGQDRQAARTGAKVEHAFHPARIERRTPPARISPMKERGISARRSTWKRTPCI